MVRMRRDPIFHVTPVNRPETHCARNAFPSVKSLREFCLNLDSVSSAMWNLGRSCRDATIGSLQSNRRKSFELSSKIRELMATFQAAGFPEHKPDRSGVQFQIN